jgi:transposase InsO family protein
LGHDVPDKEVSMTRPSSHARTRDDDDHGSQYMSDVFQDELRFLGITSSPAFVREPQGNGCAERFIRTLKEQLLWVRRFATVEELRLALHEFLERYNQHWLIERHGHQTPAAVRAQLTAPPEVAA